MRKVHGFWPDVLTKSKSKTAFNRATACNIDTNDVTSGSPRATPFTSSCISHMVEWHKTEPSTYWVRIHRRIITPDTWLLRLMTVPSHQLILFKASSNLKHVLILLDLLRCRLFSNVDISRKQARYFLQLSFVKRVFSGPWLETHPRIVIGV